MLSFTLGLVFLFLSGGILPPVLLPLTLQKLMVLSPVTWLRGVLAGELCAQYPGYGGAVAAAALGMMILGGILFRRRQDAGEAGL
jgi:hypothetical protein